MLEDEALQHTENSGEKAKTRVEELLEQLAGTTNTLAEHMVKLTEHVSNLEAQKAAEQVPATARDAVEGGIDTAGSAGNVAVKSVDVPLAVSEDVIHDTGETAKEAGQAVETSRKKLFKRKR